METLKQIHTEDGDPSELQLKHWIKGVGLLLILENIMSDLMNTAVNTFRAHYSMWVNATDLYPLKKSLSVYCLSLQLKLFNRRQRIYMSNVLRHKRRFLVISYFTSGAYCISKIRSEQRNDSMSLPMQLYHLSKT